MSGVLFENARSNLLTMIQAPEAGVELIDAFDESKCG